MSVQKSHTYRNIDIMRERISRIFDLRVTIAVSPDYFETSQYCCDLSDSMDHFGLGTYLLHL